MRERLLHAANILLLAFATLVLASLQTSLWFQVFGWFPAPAFWMPAVVYVALYRTPVEMLITVFIFCLILSTMTVMPEGMLFATLLALSGLIRAVKQRFYWAGTTYFMMTSGFATLSWHLLHWIGTSIIHSNPVSIPEIADWLIQALLTPLIAPPLYFLFRWFDRIAEREQPAEASADML